MQMPVQSVSDPSSERTRFRHSETKRKLQSAQEHSAELEIDVQRLSGQVQVLEKQLKLAEEKDKEYA